MTYKFKYKEGIEEVKEEKGNSLILGKMNEKAKPKFEAVANEKVASLLSTLRDESFGNEDQRKKMIDVMSSLLNVKDPDARSIFKKMGSFFTDLGNEMLGDNIETDVIDEVELDVGYGENNDRFIVVEDKNGKKVKKKKYEFKTLVKE